MCGHIKISTLWSKTLSEQEQQQLVVLYDLPALLQVKKTWQVAHTTRNCLAYHWYHGLGTTCVLQQKREQKNNYCDLSLSICSPLWPMLPARGERWKGHARGAVSLHPSGQPTQHLLLHWGLADGGGGRASAEGLTQQTKYRIQEIFLGKKIKLLRIKRCENYELKKAICNTDCMKQFYFLCIIPQVDLTWLITSVKMLINSPHHFQQRQT